ncbi:MAG: flavodoxin family protein [Candidatus Electrothrix sp. MAN1_4]|nr:flavodoxin family protein [Candidatus Electrothrix sp. MAN1_4]
MAQKKIVILNGKRNGDEDLDAILTLLTEVLQKHEDCEPQIFPLRNIRINHCIGCFNCWYKTPGKCIHNDSGADILQAVLNSETVIFFTPVVFGGYSSELKKILDRFLPIVLPLFKYTAHQETRHIQRYVTFPRIIGIGVHPNPSQGVSRCFKLLVGRNAANCISSSYAAEVISSMAPHETLKCRFQALLSKKDKLPELKVFPSLIEETASVPQLKKNNNNPRALLVIGSPKIKSPSTSTVLGNTLLEKLKMYGWRTEKLILNGHLNDKKEQDNLYKAVYRSDNIILSFPLYVDTLPFLVTRAFEVIMQHKEKLTNRRTKKILTLVNNGYPEVNHNLVALMICQNFAIECEMTWMGGLALGGGEGLLSGQPVTGMTGLKGLKRPPLYYVNRALNLTAEALAEGHPVPQKAVQLMAKKPFPLIPFNLWRWIYIFVANNISKKEVTKNGLNNEAIFNRHYYQSNSQK